jgi:hypothetical protein
MTNIRIIKHEVIPQTGSFEVKFSDRRPSVYHYFDDDPGRRSITGKMTSEQALELAKAAASPLEKPELGFVKSSVYDQSITDEQRDCFLQFVFVSIWPTEC